MAFLDSLPGLYPDLPILGFVALAATYFFGFFIRGAFGFGSAMPIVVISTWILSPHHAIVLVVVTTAVAQFQILPQGVRTGDWRVARPLLIGLLPGIAIGTIVFSSLEADWLTLIMGVAMTATVLLERYRVLDRISGWIRGHINLTAYVFAFVSALVGTISGAGGLYLLVVFIKLVCETKDTLRGTNVLAASSFAFSRFLFLIPAGFIDLQVALEGAILLPFSALGLWAGSRSFHRMNVDRFHQGIQILLLIGAFSLIVKGVLRLL